MTTDNRSDTSTYDHAIAFDTHVYCPNYVDGDLVSDLLHLAIPGLTWDGRGLVQQRPDPMSLGQHLPPTKVTDQHVYMALQNIVAPAIRAALIDLRRLEATGTRGTMIGLDVQFLAAQYQRCITADPLNTILDSLIHYTRMIDYDAEHQAFEDSPRVRVGRTPVRLRRHGDESSEGLVGDVVFPTAETATAVDQAAEPATPSTR